MKKPFLPSSSHKQLQVGLVPITSCLQNPQTLGSLKLLKFITLRSGGQQSEMGLTRPKWQQEAPVNLLFPCFSQLLESLLCIWWLWSTFTFKASHGRESLSHTQSLNTDSPSLPLSLVITLGSLDNPDYFLCLKVSWLEAISSLNSICCL